MAASQPVFRFAPSPNGLLHLGHARSALLNWDCARTTGGRFLLRIEDIDEARCRPDLVEAMLEDLAWLGLEWEEPRRQSQHLGDYTRALDRLDAIGLVYRSGASRGALAEAVARREAGGASWPRDPDGAAVVTRDLLAGLPEAGGPAAWRLDMPAALARLGAKASTWRESAACGDGGVPVPSDPARWGDVVLRRRDVPASYHVAVVVDDALQGVTHVVRGADLREATAVHRVLQELLGLPAPVYRHHDLVVGGDGHKLSKSLASKGLRAWRQDGATPADVRRLAGLSEPSRQT